MKISLSTKIMIISFLILVFCLGLSSYVSTYGIVSVLGVSSFFLFLGTLIFKGRYTILREFQRQNREHDENQKIKKFGEAIGSGMRRGFGTPRETTVIINNPPPRPQGKPFHIFDFGRHADNLEKTLTPPAYRPKGYKRTHLEELIEDE